MALVVLGQVVGAHALRGQVRVRYLGDGPQNLLDVDRVWLAETVAGDDARDYDVVSGGTGRSGEVRLGLEGVRDRDAAEALRRRFVLVDEAVLESLPEDEYYWHQLVGCRVETDDGRPVGVVREIWATGAHDVLVVDGEEGEQHLVPTAREWMTEVDLDQQRIVVSGVPGLLDSEADRS